MHSVLLTLLALVDARIVSRVGDSGTADDTPKHARADEAVVMYAALEADNGDWFSDAGTIVVDGVRHETRPMAEAPAFSIRWWRIEPTGADLSNTVSGKFRYEPIDYQATELAKAVTELEPDVRPTLTPDHGDGVGTMRFQISVKQRGRRIASPGTEARRKRAAGGLTDAVHRISIRRDDTYLGWLTEMFGQPYIWASAGSTDATHQSERLEGADCADFVVFGWRRLGHDVPYIWTGALPSYTKRLGAGSLADDGTYADARGKAVAFTRAGDLVLFPRHVAVLVEDRGTIGVLDVDDIVVHALFDSPKEVRIGDTGYAEKPLEIRRWK